MTDLLLAATRVAGRWYRRALSGVVNPFDSPDAARRYAEGRPDDHHAVVLAEVASLLAGVLPLDRALDVGCGTGLSTRAMNSLARRVVGVDVSEFMIREARTRARAACAVAKAEELPIAQESVDLIVASAAFHWFDQRSFLREARRIARPNAWLVVYDNGFQGHVEGVEDLRRWHLEQYLPAFPSPPRRSSFSPWLAARSGFIQQHTQRYENRIALDAEGLVRFLLTQSNVIAAIDRHEGTIDEIADRLRRELQPFFEINGNAAQRTCIFGGPLWIASRDR